MVIKLQSVAPERLGNYEGPGRMYRSPWEGEIIDFMGGLVAGENGDGKIRWSVWGETAGIEGLGGGGNLVQWKLLECVKVILMRTSKNGGYNISPGNLWLPGKVSRCSTE